MPYRVRILYIAGLSAALHAPFKLFGLVAKYLLRQLHIEARTQDTPPSAPAAAASSIQERRGRVAVLYSGGTDSTCAAALMAQDHAEVHLLTYYEHATRRSPSPTKNIERLRRHFPEVTFTHSRLSVDALVRFFSYERYISTLRQHGYLALATPGFSSLSWQVRTIAYCLEHGITRVADGLTRELMHFPGHMDATVALWKELYAEFGIEYENPVREWDTPPDRQFIEQVLVNRHSGDFLLGDAAPSERKTTGQYLFAQGILPHPNLKGSRLDFSMQHDCYPFALYNVLAFWGRLTWQPYPLFESSVRRLLDDKARVARALLRAHQHGERRARSLIVQ